jgi:hypothetical protein
MAENGNTVSVEWSFFKKNNLYSSFLGYIITMHS